MSHGVQLQAIGQIHSPYREKFGIPRQPGLVPSARFSLEFFPPYNDGNALRGLENFSHVWLQFYFHATAAQGWKPTVRPPRLGGNQRLGVFATRSSFRPNALGLSVAKLESIDFSEPRLHLSGLDLLHHTPIFDLKPYLPYADSHPQAQGGFAETTPPLQRSVCFSALAEQQLRHAQQTQANFRTLIIEVLRQDPRPAYRHALETDAKIYGITLYEWNIRFQITHSQVEVIDIAINP